MEVKNFACFFGINGNLLPFFSLFVETIFIYKMKCGTQFRWFWPLKRSEQIFLGKREGVEEETIILLGLWYF